MYVYSIIQTSLDGVIGLLGFDFSNEIDRQDSIVQIDLDRIFNYLQLAFSKNGIMQQL